MGLDQGSGSVYSTELCLLSLDGGGVRGLATLYILKQIMDQLNYERAKQIPRLTPVKPCQVFDLIGGTSTGGQYNLAFGAPLLTIAIDS